MRLSKSKKTSYTLVMDREEMEELARAITIALEDPEFYSELMHDERRFLKAVREYETTVDPSDRNEDRY